MIVRRQRGWPDARQRLEDHPGVGGVRRGAVVEESDLRLVHLPPARQVFSPQIWRFRQRIQTRSSILAAFGVVGGGSQQRIGLAGKTNAHLLMKTGK